MPTLLVVPSGIGCATGGYAGDAIPVARMLASTSGCLITHPNVMNGASLYWSDPRIFYVEGYSLDHFAIGEINLRPVRQQKIGLILDGGIEPDLQLRHLQVLDGCRASLGLDVSSVVTTDMPLGVTLCKGSSGASWGSLEHPDSLLRAGENLKKSGTTAIAVVTRFPDELPTNRELQSYRTGNGVDALAGAEALISHLMVRHLGIPCAHSPAINFLPLEPGLDPRAAGEELGFTFLTSVLVGLSRAPDLIFVQDFLGQGTFAEPFNRCISIEDVGAAVVPEGALGGPAILACFERGIPVIAVKDPSVLHVTKDALGCDNDFYKNNGKALLSAQNYIEAAGLLALIREGIAIESCRRPLKPLLENS